MELDGELVNSSPFGKSSYRRASARGRSASPFLYGNIRQILLFINRYDGRVNTGTGIVRLVKYYRRRERT